jgi:diguanylate cyclase (GGDEF)-like protein/PAS domain S-box-containing protein
MTENSMDAQYIPDEKYLGIIDSIPNPVVIFNWETKSIFHNLSFVREFACEAEVILEQYCQCFQPTQNDSERKCKLQVNHESDPCDVDSLYWQNKVYQVKVAPLSDSSHQPKECIHVFSDITDYVLISKAMRESEDKYRQLFEAESDAIFLINNDTGLLLEANQAAVDLYGYSYEELLTMKNTDLSSEPDQTQHVTRSNPIDSGTVINVPNRLHKTKEGRIFPVEITGRFFIWQGQPVHIAAIRDITERKKAEADLLESQEQLKTRLDHIQSLQEKLREQAIRDPLTGLFNRRYMEETLQREIAQAKRAKETIGLIMVDLDHFKIFNDTMGHSNGDLVLQQLGRLLNRYVREGDIACRYGGEEFLLILPGATKENTLQRAEEFRTMFETLPIEIDEIYQAYVTLSAGVAVFPEDGDSRKRILDNVDQALYRAKDQGRNRVVAYS